MSRLWLLFAGATILALNLPVFGEEPARPLSFDFDREDGQPSAVSESQADAPIPLHRDPAQRSATSSDKESEGGLPSFGTVLTALAVVLLLALGIAKMLGRNPAFAGTGRLASPVDVLFRQNIDPKNAICIVRVGPRLLVLSSSANGLSTLSEITDPIEVEALTIELRAARESSDGALGFVSRWFDRSAPTDDANARPVRSKPAPSPHDSVAGLTVREVEEGRRAG
jgi:flagellar biogenesis protein FliO